MSREKLPRWLMKRGDTFYYKRAVPRPLRGVVGDRVVWTSLKTSDLASAIVARDKVNDATEHHWKALARGATQNEREQYLAAIDRARIEGFTYKSRSAVEAETIEDLLQRIEFLERKLGPEAANDQPVTIEQEQVVAAVLGAKSEPTLRISTLLENFEELTEDERKDKSDHKLHKWRLPRIRAIANLIEVIGDKDLAAFTRSDALRFRKWWSDRVVAEEVLPGTANKDLMHIGSMIATVSDRHELDLRRQFAGLRFDGIDGRRIPFSTTHIREELIGTGKLDGLNADARAIILVMVECGARPSEVAGLRTEDIRLEDEIPHIAIRSYKQRLLKTAYSERDLPLVGVALEGARMIAGQPNSYRDRSGALSAVVSKFFDDRKLTEGEATSIYSLRHSFKDRLTEAGAPDLIDASMMGHKFTRPDYGKGPSLSLKLEWMRKTQITLDP